MYNIKTKYILWIVVFVVFLIMIAYLVWNFTSNPEEPKDSCIDVNSMTSFVFDACFDPPTENIFLDVRASSYSVYDIIGFKVYFFDETNRSYELSDLPVKGSFKTFTLPALVNPSKMELFAEVEDDLLEPICEEPKKIFVKNCIRANNSKNTPRFNDPPNNSSLIFDRKQNFWRSKCSSSWECSSWSFCDEGIQRRSCEDMNNCTVPVDAPDMTRYCGDVCVEDWFCEWSNCKENITSPKCVDVNNCGTTFNKPNEVLCSSDSQCTPNIECSEWTDCSTEYSFSDLKEGKQFKEVVGSRSRICQDKNSCVGAVRENQECLKNIDVYTKRSVRCNVEYIEIYNKLDGELIAIVDDGTNSTHPYLDINFGNSENYCDFCFNGVKDSDEHGIDCGGSCEPCDEKYSIIYHRENRLIAWLKDLLF